MRHLVPAVTFTMPRVSVVVPAYNQADVLDECLHAILASTHPAIDVIVVDDGSTDATGSVARGHPVVRLITQSNRGAAAARNAGAQQATGDYLYFLDADVVIEPSTIGCLVETAETYQVDLVFARYSTRPINRGLGPHYKAVVDYVFYIPRHLRDTVYLNGQIGGGGDFISRRAFEALGGYDSSFRGAGVEREELYIRFYEAGFRSAANPGIATRHAFPGLAELPRIYASRVAATIHLVAGRRPPFTYIQRGSLGVAAGGALALAVSVAALVLGLWPVWSVAAGLTLFVTTSRDFFAQALRRKGLLMTFAFIPVHAGVLLIILGSAGCSSARLLVASLRSRLSPMITYPKAKS